MVYTRAAGLYRRQRIRISCQLRRDQPTGSVGKAEKELVIYRAGEMRQLGSDLDRAVKLLQQQNEKNGGIGNK